MILKFIDISGDQIMEVEKVADGISFYITQNGEESIGQSITISSKEIQNLIKFLNEAQLKFIQLHQ